MIRAMAKQTIVQLTDDLDGSEAVEELTFALRGVEYEIDLNAKNAAALEKALDKYVAAGRRVGRPRAPRSGSTRNVVRRSRAAAPKGDLSSIREWAAANGYPISSRGRIPGNVKEAYAASH
jgi:hypothetical protein